MISTFYSQSHSQGLGVTSHDANDPPIRPCSRLDSNLQTIPAVRLINVHTAASCDNVAWDFTVTQDGKKPVLQSVSYR